MIAAILSSLGLGLLTAISPCPLATNVAAVSFIGREAGTSGPVLRRGFAFATGKMVGLTALAAAIVFGLIAASDAFAGIGRYATLLIGPALLVTGAVLLGLIGLPATGGLAARGEKLAKQGLLGAFLLGLLFSLSFCPTSAAIFFGSLVPLAAASDSVLLVPAGYGLASAAPVLLFAVLVAAGGRGIGRAFNRLRDVDRIMRRVAATILLVLGLYFSLSTNFGL